MFKIVVQNDTGKTVQLKFLVGTEKLSLQLEVGERDVVARARGGEAVTFYWRDDGELCVECEQSGAPCSKNSFPMAPNDVMVKLSDPRWKRQTI